MHAHVVTRWSLYSARVAGAPEDKGPGGFAVCGSSSTAQTHRAQSGGRIAAALVFRARGDDSSKCMTD